MEFAKNNLILYMILISCFSSFAGEEFENKLKEVAAELIYCKDKYKDQDKVNNLLEELREISKRENVNLIKSLNFRTFRKDAKEAPLIYWASYARMLKTAKFLIELGVNPNPAVQGKIVSSLMHDAIIWRNSTTMKFLLENGASPTDIDVTGKPPLYWALRGHRDSWGPLEQGEPEVAKVIIDAGANIDDVMQMIVNEGSFAEASSDPDKVGRIDAAYAISLKTLKDIGQVGSLNLVKFVDMALNSKNFPAHLRTEKVRRQLVKWFGKRLLKMEKNVVIEILNSL
jgi:ankyrin repeat protein